MSAEETRSNLVFEEFDSLSVKESFEEMSDKIEKACRENEHFIIVHPYLSGRFQKALVNVHMIHYVEEY